MTSHNSSSPPINSLQRQDVVDLVRHVRLRTGKIVITLHNGDAAKINIKHVVQLLLHQQPQTTEFVPTESICLDGVESLVLSRFEQAIRAQVGQFGGLKIKVVNGSLDNWVFFRSHK